MTLKHPTFVLGIPLITYLFSYCYLGMYHHTFWLFPQVIHEGGTLTFLETVFYSSHFLGHVPVHTVLAFYYIGIWMSLRPCPDNYQIPGSFFSYIIIGIVFLVGAYILSILVFGTEDTFSFVLQQKQSMTVYRPGGSWLLHFPSTILQIFLIPLYLLFFRWWFCLPSRISSRGIKFIFISFILTVIFIQLAGASWVTYLNIWSDPRYMAHSVRELATFPLTYYPLSLFLLLVAEKGTSDAESRGLSGSIRYFTMACFVLFAGGFIYQVVISLQAGIGNMAQKPAFADPGGLSIGYLLASHYFEHTLDTIYFFLFCGALCHISPQGQFSSKRSHSPVFNWLRS